MKRIDSQALGMLNKALGLTGAGSQITELEDGHVDQALDVGPIVRRSRTLAGSGGIFTARLRNTHPAADSRTAILLPYLSGTAAIAPFPSPIPEQFDVWLLLASISQVSGTGTLSAAMTLNIPASQMAMSTVGAGTAALAAMTLAFWDALITEDVEFGLLNGARGPLSRPGLRLPRSPALEIEFASTSSAAATFELLLLLGVFPVALGQDVLE